jgi:NAD(P)-dependent dehydrogenase (short-subunit alcohol dehydrogenase family)
MDISGKAILISVTVRGPTGNKKDRGATASVIEEFDASAMRRLWDVNVVAYFICAREAVRRMSRERGGAGGAIVNVSSMSADSGGIGPRGRAGAG